MSHVPGQEHPSLSHHFQNMVQGLGCSKAPPNPYNITINIARAEDTNIAFIFQGELYFGDPPFLERNLWGKLAALCDCRTSVLGRAVAPRLIRSGSRTP